MCVCRYECWWKTYTISTLRPMDPQYRKIPFARKCRCAEVSWNPKRCFMNCRQGGKRDFRSAYFARTLIVLPLTKEYKGVRRKYRGAQEKYECSTREVQTSYSPCTSFILQKFLKEMKSRFSPLDCRSFVSLIPKKCISLSAFNISEFRFE